MTVIDTMTWAWVREGDIQAGPLGAENRQEGRAPATHIHEGAPVWIGTGLRITGNSKFTPPFLVTRPPVPCGFILLGKKY